MSLPNEFEQLETGQDLLSRLSDYHNEELVDLDDPLYATTRLPFEEIGSGKLFVIIGVDQEEVGDEVRTVLRLKEVASA